MVPKMIAPTRAELSRNISRQKMAESSLKLLKTKHGELMRQIDCLKPQQEELRGHVNSVLRAAHEELIMALAIMSPKMLQQALLYQKNRAELDVDFDKIASVPVPVYSCDEVADGGAAYPYGFLQTSGELDDAISMYSGIFADMLELARIEKTLQLLTCELEKTRVHIRALECRIIPEAKSSIQHIATKLDEDERLDQIRVSRIKSRI